MKTYQKDNVQYRTDDEARAAFLEEQGFKEVKVKPKKAVANKEEPKKDEPPKK